MRHLWCYQLRKLSHHEFLGMLVSLIGVPCCIYCNITVTVTHSIIVKIKMTSILKILKNKQKKETRYIKCVPSTTSSWHSLLKLNHHGLLEGESVDDFKSKLASLPAKLRCAIAKTSGRFLKLRLVDKLRQSDKRIVTELIYINSYVYPKCNLIPVIYKCPCHLN